MQNTIENLQIIGERIADVRQDLRDLNDLIDFKRERLSGFIKTEKRIEKAINDDVKDMLIKDETGE